VTEQRRDLGEFHAESFDRFPDPPYNLMGRLRFSGRSVGVATGLPEGAFDVTNEIPTGFYQDASGNLKRDRRVKTDRRGPADAWDGVDRRQEGRRHTDYAATEREHDRMIEDALEEFAAEHPR